MFLYGASGNGKSSLVNAGLLPQARKLGYEPVRVRVQPRAGDELVVDPILTSDETDEALPFVLAEAGDESTRLVLSTAEFEERVHRAAGKHRPLIIFDQFEEILTLFDDATDARDAIAALIGRLLRDTIPVKLLFAFREDYLGGVKQLLAGHPELVDRALRLGPPSPDALRLIIRGPFDRFPGHFERELDAELAERLRSALAERFGTGNVSLSEVQTVCLRLWRSDDPGTLLTQKGVQGLLEDELGEALDNFAPDLRTAAIALLSEMVTDAGTRNVIAADDLKLRVREEDPGIKPELLDEALDRLEGEAKLIRRERRRDLFLYEITSEFLVPWITKRREELTLQRERQRQRRRMRILGAIAAGMTLVVAIVAVLAVWALNQRSEARRQTADATSLALATSSHAPLGTRPDISLALAYGAYRESPRPEAHSSVIEAIVALRSTGLKGVISDGELVYGVGISNDSKILAVGAIGGDVTLWDPRTHKLLARLTGQQSIVWGFAFSPDGTTLAAGVGDGTVRLWNLKTHALLAKLSLNCGPVRKLAISPDGTTLAAPCQDGTVRLVSMATRKEVARLAGHHEQQVNGVAFSPDSKTLASAGDDGTIGLWNVATGKRRATLTGHTTWVLDVAFSPDGTTLASASGDGTVRLWSAATHRTLARLAEHKGAVATVAFSPDGRTLASGGVDRTVRLWSPASHRQLARFSGHGGPVNDIAFSADGRLLASTGDDATVRLVDPAAYGQFGRLAGHASEIEQVAFSPDGSVLASASEDTTIRLWNPTTRTQIAQLTGNTQRVEDVAISPDGKLLVSAGADQTVRVWDLATRRQLAKLHGDDGSSSKVGVTGVAFSPDGTMFASVGADGTVRLWDTRTRRLLRRMRGPINPHGVAFSPDGKTLASVAEDATTRVWDPATGKQLAVLREHKGDVWAAAFSPDGKILASAGTDGTIVLWDATTRELLGRLTGSQNAIYGIAFTPDGKTLASAGSDNTVGLWDPVARTPLGKLTGHTDDVIAVAFSPDGKTLASAGVDRTIRLWPNAFPRTAAELRTAVCGLRVADPTPAEWARFAPGVSYRRACS